MLFNQSAILAVLATTSSMVAAQDSNNNNNMESTPNLRGGGETRSTRRNMSSSSSGLICGVAIEGIPATGISKGCDSALNDNILRYGYGFDGCSYNKGPNAPQHKTPDCDPNNNQLFNLVDEPTDYVQAAQDWMEFADQHAAAPGPFQELVQQGRVTSPGTTGDIGWILAKLKEFFDTCQGCNDPTSHRYIGTISFHAFANTNTNVPVSGGGSAVAPFAGNIGYILNTMVPAIKKAYPDKQIAMTNFGVIGSTSTASDEIAFIHEFFAQLPHSQAAGKLNYAYYFAARDVCGQVWNPPWTGCAQHNGLCEAGIVEALNQHCV